jgi:hypothetical protein
MFNTKLNNYIDVINIEPSSCDISCHEDCFAILILPILVENLLAIFLQYVAVKRLELSVVAGGKPLSFRLGISKNKELLVFVLEEIIFKNSVFLGVRVAYDTNTFNAVRNLSGVSADEVNQNGIDLLLAGNLLNVLRNGCTEDHGLGIRHRVLNSLNIFVKAHIQHLVPLIKDLVLAVGQVQVIVLAKINESTWCCNNNLRLSLTNLKHYNHLQVSFQFDNYFGLSLS